VHALFRADRDLMTYFNEEFADGKWQHFADQPHIGYTSWRDPPEDNLDAITFAALDVPEAAGLGVAVDGSRMAWPGTAAVPTLPELDAINQRRS
jgi:hypothetical protein